jgi:1-phosphofructokinase family hexose kinase
MDSVFMRIITLTLHPAIDRGVAVGKLLPGEVLDSRLLFTTPAGKGVNTARVLRRLEGKERPIVAAVWLGEAEADWFRVQLKEISGISAAICSRSCPTRQAQTIFEASGVETHIKETMAPARPAEERALLAFWQKLLRPGDVISLCGSAPAGTSPKTLHRIFSLAKSKKARALIADCNGPALDAAGLAGVDGLKGNAAETGAWLGLRRAFKPGSPEHRRKLRAVFERPAAPGAVMITLGASGAALANPGGLWLAQPPKLRAKGLQSSTGCGDAATAGWLWALLDGCGPEETLHRAVACGTAKLFSIDPGKLEPSLVRKLLRAIKVKRECPW